MSNARIFIIELVVCFSAIAVISIYSEWVRHLVDEIAQFYIGDEACGKATEIECNVFIEQLELAQIFGYWLYSSLMLPTVAASIVFVMLKRNPVSLPEFIKPVAVQLFIPFFSYYIAFDGVSIASVTSHFTLLLAGNIIGHSISRRYAT